MELNLQRPLLFYDIESTGLSIVADSIVELCFVKVLPDHNRRIKTWRVCPWDYEKNTQKPITQGAKDVTGITDEELRDCPKFYEIVGEVVSWLKDEEEGGEAKGCDLAGFNSNKFDLPMLAEEIEKARIYLKSVKDESYKSLDINLHEMTMVDIQAIYHTMEPRNLKAAYRFYCGGKELVNAHSAEADTIATYEVLKGQLDMYQEPDPEYKERPVLKNDVAFLANVGNIHSKYVDYAGRLIYDANNEPVINFGKHKGKSAKEVYEKEPAYFAWIAGGEFSYDTKRQFELIKEECEKKNRTARQERHAAMRKPLEGKDFDDATSMLMEHFGMK